MSSHFTYQKILVIGATSGIGQGLAEKFVKEGKAIVIAGRREEKLKDFQNTHGDVKVSYEVFDVTDLKAIPSFVEKVTKDHPDLDCVFINSGIQRGFNFSKPETVDLDTIELELTTNYTSCIHLTKAFLPFLMKKEHSALMYTTSQLALVPMARCPNYCATKAALHQFLMSLRYHLKDTSVQVLEVFPPAVQTELHDDKHQPDIKDGRSIGMPLDAFVDETWKKLNEGNAYGEFPIGEAETSYTAIEPGRKYMISQYPHYRAPANV